MLEDQRRVSALAGPKDPYSPEYHVDCVDLS